MKKVIQRNLSILQEYEIVDSWHTDEPGNCCNNCGKPISNIAQIKGLKDNSFYYVGMDCAGTLSGIKDSFDYEYVHKTNFRLASQIRSKAKKHFKRCLDWNKEQNKNEVSELNISIYETEKKVVIRYDSTNISRLSGGWNTYDLEVYKKYIEKSIKDLITKTTYK